MRVLLALVISLTLAGCGSHSQTSSPQPKAETPKQKTVFDPLLGTLDRAKGVQQTVDDQAAEQRRQIEQAEK